MRVRMEGRKGSRREKGRKEDEMVRIHWWVGVTENVFLLPTATEGTKRCL